MKPTGNLLLAALPTSERDALMARARTVSLTLGELLYEQDALVQDTYFPLSGAVSVLVTMEDGRALEPALIGREGMLGFPIGLGDNRSRWRSVVQLAGEAVVISRADLSAHLRTAGNLAALLTHYAGLLITFTAQSAACNRFHDLEQRTARWLLVMHDRAEDDTITITQDFFAFMLGVHRPSETLALDALRDARLIAMARGEIRIVDREGLEASACECYARVERDYRELVQIASEFSIGEGHSYGTEDGSGHVSDAREA